MPAAPPLFSTSTDWPSDSCSFCAITRVPTSVPPPGGNGTMMRIGFEGEDWEKENLGNATARTSRSRSRILFVAHVQDFELLDPARRPRVNDFARFLPGQRPRDRRGD